MTEYWSLGSAVQATVATVVGSTAEFNVLAADGTTLGLQPAGTATRRFFHTDLLGSTRAVVTETGALASRHAVPGSAGGAGHAARRDVKECCALLNP